LVAVGYCWLPCFFCWSGVGQVLVRDQQFFFENHIVYQYIKYSCWSVGLLVAKNGNNFQKKFFFMAGLYIPHPGALNPGKKMNIFAGD
jgi:hypothetical protein